MYRILLIGGANFVHWLALDRELTLFLTQQDVQKQSEHVQQVLNTQTDSIVVFETNQNNLSKETKSKEVDPEQGD